MAILAKEMGKKGVLLLRELRWKPPDSRNIRLPVDSLAQPIAFFDDQS